MQDGCLDKVRVASLPEPVKVCGLAPLQSNQFSLKRPPSKMVNTRYLRPELCGAEIILFFSVSLFAPVLKFKKWYTLPSVKLNDIQMTIFKSM
jgi:hypothetical protein